MFSFGHCPNYLSPHPSPQFGLLVPLFLDVKNDVLARITERSKDDYDNDVSDNCDHNFGTFDDFGVKNDQKVSNNMILMSKYKGKHGGKKGQKIRAWVDPPPTFGQCPKENVFFEQMSSLTSIERRTIHTYTYPTTEHFPSVLFTSIFY